MKKNKKIILPVSIILIILIVLAIITFFIIKKSKKDNSIKENNNYSKIEIEVPIAKQSKNKAVDINSNKQKNEQDVTTETITKQETDIEFNTQYRQNSSLAKGKIQTLQEGKDGKQNAVIKSVYKNGELISEEQISSEITEGSIDKIVEIGTASFSSNYVPIIGDKLRVTPTTMAVHVDPDENSEKLITLNKDDQVILRNKQDNWYYIQYNTYLGWAPSDCLEYVDPNAGSDGDENNVQFTKEQLSQNLGFSMLVNQRSNLTLEQFKKILSQDSNDKNNVFSDNAEYFYYAEKQYNINGVFLAAIGIHESGWGTSSISLNKKNLFGYQAYDRDPSGNATGFETYAQGIDLVARVLVKYYLNPPGTSIYDGETAIGRYYYGSTITAVNKCYATDKNWANGVYKWMVYLYNKL